MAILHIRSFGPPDAPPVLIVHGVRNIGARFRRLAEEGLPEYRVVAPDLRGHGGSTWDPPWHAERHVADLLDTMDAHGVARAAVVGHSFGGLLATHLAAVAPGRVSRIALVDPAIALDPALAARGADDSLVDESWASPAEALADRRSLRPDHARETADEDLATFLAQGGPDGRCRLSFSRAAVVCAWSEMARPVADLGDFGGSALLVTARRAAFVTDALRQGLARDLGSRVREESVDAGHMLFWDAFEELVGLLRPFLLAEGG